MAMSAGFPMGEELPERIGHYVIRRRIGQGGMGVVYQAEDPRTEQFVAVKVLKPEVAGDHIARARLHREVETMRRVQSPNVAEVIDADTQAELPWVVTEYIPGPTLDATVTDHGPLRGRALTRFVTGLARAIKDIHAIDVIHRDLKPGNVIISNGEPIVIDFGIAHAVDGAKLTQTGTFVGTPSYLSPEVIEGTDLGSATDIHAWGGTVAFASTGRPPYGAGTFEVIFYRILNGEIDLDGMHEALMPLVKAAVTRDMARRPSADQLVAETSRLNLDLPWDGNASSPGFGGGAVLGGVAEVEEAHLWQPADGGHDDGAAGDRGGEEEALPVAAHESGGVQGTRYLDPVDPEPQRAQDPSGTMMMPPQGRDAEEVSTYEAPPSDAPQTQFFNTPLAKGDFSDILPPVGQDQRSPGHTQEFDEDDYDDGGGGFMGRFRRGRSDRLGDYFSGGEADSYDDGEYYDDHPGYRMHPLMLLPLMVALAGTALWFPWFGYALGVLVIAGLGALDVVKAEHERRLQTRGPRGSDGMVVALSFPWAFGRMLVRTVLFGLVYLIGGILVGLVYSQIVETGSEGANYTGGFAIFVAVLLGYIMPSGREARHQAVWAVRRARFRNIYLFVGLNVAVVLLMMFILSIGLSAAPEWTPFGGPSDWFSE
ncbi:serine/threonine-protein kinase [Nocardiopsis sp. LOL_012]|uniref:serine/threonine-protein kinase n=1 Tax=Nocardiopsis sp. LOL_012 TaxID=3345409 RepID=UPI003A85EA9D